MTRPIEFRLLNEHNEIVGYEKWYVGSFNMETKKDYYVAQPCWLYSIDEIYYNPTPINHRYKNQFTVLLDRNGKKIFEGDILQDRDKRKSPVFYDTEMAKFDTYALEKLTYNNALDYEIIGNIYEHPELLK